MRTLKLSKFEVKALHVERVIMVKAIVGVGILAAVFLPGQIAVLVSTVTNLIWLTKL